MHRRTALLRLASGIGLAAWSSNVAIGASNLLGPLLPIRVGDEFGALKAAIVHDASNARDIDFEDLFGCAAEDMLRQHPETGPVEAEGVVREMAAFRDLLVKSGVTILPPAPIEDAFCQVFTRDPSFAVGKTLFVGRLSDPHRKMEKVGLDPVLAGVSDETSIEGEDATIEGGDVMVRDQGKTVLVGIGPKTNEAGFLALADLLKTQGVEAHRVPHKALHLDCALAPLPDGRALFQPRALPPTRSRPSASSIRS